MISLNALLGRPVEYYEYPWAIEGRLRDAQSRFRSRFQPSDVGYIFAKSMPRSGHRFLSECLAHYFGARIEHKVAAACGRTVSGFISYRPVTSYSPRARGN